MEIYKNVMELVGNTPIVELGRYGRKRERPHCKKNSAGSLGER